jgi:hypothetical protein
MCKALYQKEEDFSTLVYLNLKARGRLLLSLLRSLSWVRLKEEDFAVAGEIIVSLIGLRR